MGSIGAIGGGDWRRITNELFDRNIVLWMRWYGSVCVLLFVKSRTLRLEGREVIERGQNPLNDPTHSDYFFISCTIKNEGVPKEPENG